MKAIFIIGYGSNEPDAQNIMKLQVGKLTEDRTYPVYYAFTRVNSPSVPEALAKMAEDGVDEAAVVPLIVSDSSVSTEAIPGMLRITYPEGTAEVNGKKIRLIMTPAVGTSPGVVDIFLRDIANNCGKLSTPLMVVGHGSKDERNPAAVRKVAEALQNKGYEHVFVCFNEFSEPTVEEAFSKALDLADDLIIALPMFMAGGVHITRDIPPKIGIAEREKVGCVDHNGKKVMVVLAPCIGHDPMFADVILSRANEALKENRA